MTKFAVAFHDRETAERIASLLRESGFEVIRTCSSADEVRRTFRMIQDGVLIAGVRLRNRSLDEVAGDLNEHVEILCLCRPDQFAQISSDKIFRQAMPVNRSVLIAWADMLAQLHYQRMPRRPESDRETIRAAKELLMEQKQMDEAEAHRHLQRLSMNLGLPMAKVAQRIIAENSEQS
ncbi:MAG: ANTAR domain-containing protein [Solobacterium sp.]|nr:ANTAR domain-containing protein [Solobacterium sp.]